MKNARIVCVVCLVLSVRLAAGQEPTVEGLEPSYQSVMEIRTDAAESTSDDFSRQPAYSEAAEVAQAPRPATTLAPPVVRGNAPQAVATEQVLPTPQTITPEMWFYSQELNRHDDPAQAVRRKAEIRAAQRMQRIAAMKWFGFSNARPQASTTPMMGVYSPAWIGNGYDRYDWAGASWPSTAVIIENYEIRR
jgi:hypothetical protein